MYRTLLQYIILICLCYPVQRKLSNKDITLEMKKTEKFENKKIEENRPRSQINNKGTAQRITEFLTAQEYISVELCLVFFYHMPLGRVSTESILVTTALFLWKASAFPVKCPAEPTREAEQRKPRSVSTKENRECVEHENECYYIVEEMKNYKAASAHCAALGSELVSVRNQNKNTFVKDLANKNGVSGYLWTNVQQNVCTKCLNVVGGHTNDKGVSECVMVNLQGQWRDFDCEYLFPYVCEKALGEAYTEKQLFIALLVPIFSCLTVAISFTTVLLVSSVRSVGQPFKLASRYKRTKKERKPTSGSWDVVDALRRASMQTQKGSKTSPSAPDIEITKADDTNSSAELENAKNRKQWYRRASPNKVKTLSVSEDRRRSSNSTISGNNSLYELLVKLNKMEFEDKNETRVDEEEIQLEDLAEKKQDNKNGVRHEVGEVESRQRDQFVKKRQPNGPVNNKASFRNMAFRDSVASVETNSSGITWVTSLQQVNQRDSTGIMEDITSDTVQFDECPRDSARNVHEESDAGKNTQTVIVHVHSAANNAGHRLVAEPNAGPHARLSSFSENIEKTKEPSKGKVIWTYSL